MTLDQTRVPAALRSADGRLPAIDALRAFLVAWIIAGHALLGYSTVGGWAYSHIAEVRFDPVVEWVLAAVIGSTGVFLIGTFFLIAGVFTSVALQRHGARGFVPRRLLRLGVPYLAVVLVLWPLTKWMSLAATDRAMTGELLWDQYRNLRTGAGWFIGVLLLLSLGYLLWWWAVPGPHGSLALRGRHLVLAGAGIAVASFAVRLWLPAHGREIGDLHLWEWPQIVGPFLLGAACGRSLVVRVRDPIYRGSGRTVLATVLAIPALALLLGIGNVAEEAPLFVGGWTWQSMALAAVHGLLVTAGSLWLLGFAQRHVEGTGPVATGSARASYTAFLLQNPVLMGLAVLLRPFELPAEVKAPVVAAAAVAVCFALGHLVVDRTRLGRVL